MSEEITKELRESSIYLLQSMETLEFYTTLIVAGAAMALAWLISFLIQRRMQQRFETRPPQYIDRNIILKPLTLLTAILAILYMGVAKPWVESFIHAPLYDAIIRMTIAYMGARIVLLIMRNSPMGYFLSSLVMLVSVLHVIGFLEPVTAYFDSVAFSAGDFKISLLSAINAVIALVIVFWIAGLLSHTLESYLRRSSHLSYSMRELTVKFFRIFLYFVAFLIALSSAGIDLTAFAVLGGAIGVGIGLGLQQLTSNFISGITLLMEKSIRLGDLVEIGQDTGWVRQLNVRYLLLETFDGREIFIPNADFAQSRVLNWTHSNYRARISIDISVAYGSDADQVMQILLECARTHPLCLKDPAPQAYLRTFGENGLNFLLIFWINDVREGRYEPQSDVMLALYKRFAQEGIEIPFPQRVLHMATTVAVQQER
ncbi:MAG: mechanosensitive ion channel family protein [Alphaproteobacteria bacterium]